MMAIAGRPDMPLYDYVCKQCGHEFEVLVRPGSAAPACASCGGSQLERLLSGFAVSSEHTRALNLAAGRKYYAKDRKDKAMAQLEYEKHHREEH
jgi:putative FmdB family regulatory protein